MNDGAFLILLAACAGVPIGLALAELPIGRFVCFGRRIRIKIGPAPRLRETLWDSVHMDDGKPLPTYRLASLLPCRHTGKKRKFVRVDSREGPGWMSDSYAGECCALCGRILSERKVY